MDATEILKNDHAVIEALFLRYQEMTRGRASEKSALFKEIRDELEAHSTIEEEIFYPAVREAHTPRAERLVREALEEHRLVRQLVRDLADGDPGSDAFDAKFKVLKENVLHHAKEEENDIFPEARSSMSFGDLDRLGQELADRKHQLGGRLRRPPPLLTRVKRAVSRAKRWISATPDARKPSTRKSGHSRKARARARRR